MPIVFNWNVAKEFSLLKNSPKNLFYLWNDAPFLKFCHQQVSLAWLVRLLLWKFVKTRCLNLLQLFSNQDARMLFLYEEILASAYRETRKVNRV